MNEQVDHKHCIWHERYSIFYQSLKSVIIGHQIRQDAAVTRQT